MGLEASATSASNSVSTSPSPNGKRSRDPEDEVYVDNLHSHKRYLSEIMASSLNGLTVGDQPLPENLLESPARSDGMFYLRDEMPMQQYSPMSEDSDDARYYDCPMNTSVSQPESLPTSPVSPCRYQRLPSGLSSNPTTSYASPSTAPVISSSQPRQRGSDSEGRFPSSPSDICHSADLRRAALLRSVQMRTHPSGPSPFELPSSVQDHGHNIEAEDPPCSYMKVLIDEREYQIIECSPDSIPDSENREKSCRMLNMNLKRE